MVDNLPRRPRERLLGREAEIAQLDRLLASGSGALVHGRDGCGKTELALRQADRHRERYPVIWWLNASSPASVESGLAALAYELEPGAADPQPAAARRARRWLRDNPDWLLILDDVLEPSSVDTLAPGGPTGQVITVSRADLGDQPSAVRLGPLTAHAAAGVLGGADAVEELQRLPLALRLGAAYLERTGASRTDLARRLRGQPADLRGWVGVIRMWRVTRAALRHTEPRALELLETLACLGPDPVPADLVADDPKLALLQAYGLVEVTPSVVGLHRLVRIAVRQSCDGPAWDAARADAQARLLAGLPAGLPAGLSSAAATNASDLPRWLALSPHILALAEVSDLGGTDEPRRELFGRTSEYLASQGRDADARWLDRRARAAARSTADRPG
jgi:hypothetical protein